MQTSHFLSIIETIYYLRILKLLKYTCLNLFRDILMHRFSKVHFSMLLQMSKTHFMYILNDVQREILFPKSGIFKGKFEDLDLPLLQKILYWLQWKALLPATFDLDTIYKIGNMVYYSEHHARIIIVEKEVHICWDNFRFLIGELERGLDGISRKYREALYLIRSRIENISKEGGSSDITANKFQCSGMTSERKAVPWKPQKERERLDDEQDTSEHSQFSSEESKKEAQSSELKGNIKLLTRILAILKDKKLEILQTNIIDNMEDIILYLNGEVKSNIFSNDVKSVLDIIETVHMDNVLCRLSKEVQNRNKRIIRIYGALENVQIFLRKVIVIVYDGSNDYDFATWEGYPLKWKPWRCPPEEGAYISDLEKSYSFNEVTVYEMESVLRDHAQMLFTNHSNLEVSSISAYRSQQNGNVLEKQWCIALYCSCKGVVPLREKEFPRSIKGFPTDIREGFFYWFPNNTGARFSKNPKDVLQSLVMGCSIGGKDKNLEGTLGGFVWFENGADQERGLITTAHTFFDQPQTSNIEIVQPSYGIQNENNVCGVHIRSVFPTQQDQHGVSVDASLVKLTERFPDRGTFSGYTVADLSLLGFSKEKPPEYDTDEIRDYRNNKHVNERGNACCKSGTSSGFTKGYLKLNGLAVKYHDPSIPFSNSPSFCGFHYYSQLEINHLKGLKDFAQAGDSGALVFQIDPQGCDKDDKLVCIGMVVGGTSFGTTVVTPIASVLDELKVKFLPLKLEAMEC